MPKSSSSTLALAGALALGLGLAFTSLADVAHARGGGGGGGAGGATGGIDIVTPVDRSVPAPTGGRGVTTYTNEFPEDDPPIIVIPLPRRSSAPQATGQMEPCYQNHLRPDARILCERRGVRF